MTAKENWEFKIPINKDVLTKEPQIDDLEKIVNRLEEAYKFANEASGIDRTKTHPKWKKI